MRFKVTVIGAGNVGSATAQRIASYDTADVVLLDDREGIARGVALDLNQAGPVSGYEPTVVGTSDWTDAAGADVVVLTSGHASGPDGVARAVESAAREMFARCPDAVVVVAAGPVAEMCHVVADLTRFPRPRIAGMAGILDSARLRTFLAWELGVSARDVEALVLGGRGEHMVPVLSCATVAGTPVAARIPAGRLEEIVRRTREGEAEVAGLLGSDSACHAPAAALAEMVDSILRDRKRVLPCSALLLGEYGIEGVFCGVPVVLGREGIEDIVEIDLDENERSGLAEAAEAVRRVAGSAAPSSRAAT